MELVIKGIDKLVGQTILGKTIKSIQLKERFGARSQCYSFTMEGGGRNKKGLRDWNSEFEVVLSKFPNPNNSYELFCMGWHGVTCVYLLKEEIANRDVFISYFEDTLNNLRKYFDSESKRV